MTKDEIVREEIIDNAQLIFQQYGYKKTTMEEIAHACGKAKSTLYYYFNNKEEVFDAVFIKETNSLRESVQLKVNQKDSISDKFITYITCFHEEITSLSNIYRILKEEFKDKILGDRYMNMIIENEKQYVTTMFQEGYDSFSFESLKREDLPWLAETSIVAFMGIVRYSIESPDGFQQEKLERAANALIPRIFNNQ